MKIFLDANILFTAAHNPAGKSHFLIKSTPSLCCTCTLALEEARKNLELKAPECLKELERISHEITVVPTRMAGDEGGELPKKDKAILRTAESCKATHLLTGDLKHFGPLMGMPDKAHGIKVMTVGEFLESI